MPSVLLQRLNSTSHLSCERMWELDVDGGPQEANQAFENKCYRRRLGVSHKEHKTNEYVWQQGLLLSIVASYHSWFGHIYYHDTPPEIIPQGTVGGSRHRVNHKRTTSENGQASRRRHCCISRMTQVDGQSPQWIYLSEYSNDAWASQILRS